MKIYADENIERSIIEGLRRRKIEVFSAKEPGYLRYRGLKRPWNLLLFLS